MKILVILTGGIRDDGITSVWLTYCKEFIRQKYFANHFRIDFAFIDDLSKESEMRKFKELGIKTIELPNRLHHPLKYLKCLVRILKESSYDVIHANGSSSLMCIEMFAGKIAKTPVRISHSRNTECSFGFLNILLRPFFLHLCNGRFACGEAAGKWLFGKKDFVIINNGKDFAKFHYSAEIRTEMRQKLKLSDKIVVGHVGCFTKIKNQSFLIDVFDELQKLDSNAVLYLMGIGGMLDEMKEKARNKGLDDKIIFAELVNDMPERLHAMDVMALPSLHEGLPNVVLEWQALGLPCLLSDAVTKACAVSDLVEFESLQQTANDWARHLHEIIKKKRMRDEDAGHGVQALKNAGFDISDNIRFLYEQYEKLVKFYRQ